jgi:hypothetical protein
MKKWETDERVVRKKKELHRLEMKWRWQMRMDAKKELRKQLKAEEKMKRKEEMRLKRKKLNEEYYQKENKFRKNKKLILG